MHTRRIKFSINKLQAVGYIAALRGDSNIFVVLLTKFSFVH